MVTVARGPSAGVTPDRKRPDVAGLVRLVPAYPALFVAAWIIALLTESTASVYALPRPLLVFVMLVITIQTALTLAVRNRHVAAIMVLWLELLLLGSWSVTVVASAALAVGLGIAVRQGRTLSRLPLSAVTRGLNTVSAITLGIVLATAVSAGALTPPERAGATARFAGEVALPDVYLILVDGHPRSDTLARQFGYDDGPFLDQMRALEFEVASNSHTNYNGTELTLASMFNSAQVVDLPEYSERLSSVQAQSRALTRAINQGKSLEVLHAAGYEIVTIPSEVSSVTLFAADRIIDSGNLTSFEFEILQEGLIRRLAPDLQRPWLMDQHRERIETAFARLGTIARERVDHPRFVFAHVMAPHAPVAFGPAGEGRDGWPCFPTDCSIFYGGQEYGDEVLDPIRGEVEFIDTRVAETAEQIQANSDRPPVIIVFSDHGLRHDFDDPDEMLRSLFIASTPERPALFPGDVTPVNIVPRLLNAYAGLQLPMATEESYVVDMRNVDETGILDLVPWSSKSR